MKRRREHFFDTRSYESNTVTKKKRPSNYQTITWEYEDMTIELKKLISWYNFRLAEQCFNKNASGIYIWSRTKTIGKTLLCRVLAMIDNVYFWNLHDDGWQQTWQKGRNYKLLVFNALNEPLLPFYMVESLGDQYPITVRQRNERNPDKIKAKTPFIITSNVPPDELGYRGDIEVWTERMIVINTEEELFELIDKIKEIHGIELEEDDELPDILK